MKTILTAAGVAIEAELAQFVQKTVDFATWNEGETAGVAFVQLAKIQADDSSTRCVIRAMLEGLGPITVSATGSDAWEAVSRTGDLLESSFIARLNRVASRGPLAGPAAESRSGPVSQPPMH